MQEACALYAIHCNYLCLHRFRRLADTFVLCSLAHNLLLRFRKLTHWMRFVVNYWFAIHFCDSGNLLVTQRNLRIGYNSLLLSIDVILF
jgi:hypothetical protein